MPLERIEKGTVPPAVQVTASANINTQKGSQATHSATLSELRKVRPAESDIDRRVKTLIPIDYNTYRAVKSFSSRVRFIVMHYTAANFKTSVELLTRGQVSAHYLVPDPADPTYNESGNKEVKIFNLVDEKERAWHAGVSSWRGRSNLNDTSIGIEIVNQATDDGHGHFTFPPFHPQQISAIKALATNIIQRYPDITPVNIVGHSDIAPGRKSDPGAAFPWQQLYQEGIGAWYDENTKAKYAHRFSQEMPTTVQIISKLKAYGYNVAETANRDEVNAVIRAFQLHFRADDYSGKIDVETAAILYALVEKYA